MSILRYKNQSTGLWEGVEAGGIASEIINPSVAPTLSQSVNAGSTLPATTYYVKYTWVNALGETQASPESTFTLASGNQLVTTVPTLPTGVTSVNVYISTTTGTETKQGNTTSTSYTQSVALVSGAALPSSNTTKNAITPDKIGVLSGLTTTARDLTGAVNEVQQMPVNAMSRQALINANLDVWQRGVSINATGGTIYTADRWCTNNIITNQASTISKQDGSGITGGVNCLRYQRNSGQTGTNYMWLGQSLETQDSKKLTGKKLTLSFWARIGSGASSASLIANILSGTGTDQNVINGFTGSAYEASQSCPLTTSWQKINITTPSVIATSKSQIGIMFSYAPSGTAGANDYFEIAQVQVNAGDQALPFQPRIFAEELQLCQRYYETLGNARMRVMDATSTFVFTRDFRPKRIANPTVTVTAATGDALTLDRVTSSSASFQLNGAGIRDAFYSLTIDAEL